MLNAEEFRNKWLWSGRWYHPNNWEEELGISQKTLPQES